MKRIILLLAVICGISNIASAQYYNDTFLFIEVGKTIENSSSIIYIHFDDDGNMYKNSMSKSTARSKYKDGILEEYGVNKKHDITRDYSISSSKYNVFSKTRMVADKYEWLGWGYGWSYKRNGTEYYGISRSEMVTWNTTNESNEAKNKKYYKAISPSDLIPKEVEYDFL